MNLHLTDRTTRRKAVWGSRWTAAILLMLLSAGLASDASAASGHARQGKKQQGGLPGASKHENYRLDRELTDRSTRGNALRTTRVIVSLVPGAEVPAEFKRYAQGGKLDIINSQVLELPNGILKKLAAHPDVFNVHYDRPTGKFNYRTVITVGAATVHQDLGFTGSGIGIAVLDSGITSWHDDLTNTTSKQYPYGNQRVTKFVDFVNGRTTPYDDNGHGSHVAGIIAGNGSDSNGEKGGVAPKASLISLKVLDANGQGSISQIIAALNWVATNAKTYNIRVVNMSVGAGIHESFWTDPLTLATKRLTDMGITVVCAAGNLGKDANGDKQYGGITAPGNAPWVLTVGASSTMGTLTRLDDTMASYSSRGPTFLDFMAKPDLVAPGTGTVSLAVPGSTFYTTKAAFLVKGLLAKATMPYLSLSGTSMAAPVVSGTVALMLQANPSLTPNLIKAILQYTAQPYPGYKPLEQGAGFLNSLGAVRLAQFYATPVRGSRMPVQTVWSKQLIWGNHMLSNGFIDPKANAWANSVVWGSAKTLGASGANIVWGTARGGDNIVWGTSRGDDNIVWGTTTGSDDNVVWGTSRGDDNIVWGTTGSDDNVVWGTARGDDNIVWGTDCGGADCDDTIWGTASADDNIVWGTAAADDNIAWGTSRGGDNIVWGTSSDSDETWGSSGDEGTVFPDEAGEPVPDLASEMGDPTSSAVVTNTYTGVTTTTVTNLVTGAVVSTTVVNPFTGTATVTTVDPTTGAATTVVKATGSLGGI